MPCIAEDEWGGVCACGKAEMDGKRCALGATHESRTALGQLGPCESVTLRVSDLPSIEDLLA